MLSAAKHLLLQITHQQMLRMLSMTRLCLHVGSRLKTMPGNRSINILVVDDDPDTQDLLREVLSEEGYNVATSGSGEEALKIGEQELFDVIISDMKLGPNLNGLTC